MKMMSNTMQPNVGDSVIWIPSMSDVSLRRTQIMCGNLSSKRNRGVFNYLRFRLRLCLSVINRMAIHLILEKDKYLQFLCVPPN